VQEVHKGKNEDSLMLDRMLNERSIRNNSGKIGEGFRHLSIVQLEDEIKRLNKKTKYGVNDTKFSDYQLPGGDNYREMLLTLSDAKPPAYTAELNRLASKYDVQPSYVEVRKLGVATDAELEDLRALSGKQKEVYKSSHYNEKNILAHVRYNERKDADGKHVLFIEEIQSDWHQAGRKGGYNVPKDKIIEQLKEEGWVISKVPFDNHKSITESGNLRFQPRKVGTHETGVARETESRFIPTCVGNISTSPI